jgi:hypothetical protein
MAEPPTSINPVLTCSVTESWQMSPEIILKCWPKRFSNKNGGKIANLEIFLPFCVEKIFAFLDKILDLLCWVPVKQNPSNFALAS